MDEWFILLNKSSENYFLAGTKTGAVGAQVIRAAKERHISLCRKIGILSGSLRETLHVCMSGA